MVGNELHRYVVKMLNNQPSKLRIYFNEWETIKKDTVIVKVKPIISKIVLRDPKDHPILQTARKGNANFIISGDEDLLTIRKWKEIRIVTMNEFNKIQLI